LATGAVDVGFGSGQVYAGNFTGFLVRDAASKTGFVAASNWQVVSTAARFISATSTLSPAQLQMAASVAVANTYVDWNVTVTDTSRNPRAISVYFALPVSSGMFPYFGVHDGAFVRLIKRACSVGGLAMVCRRAVRIKRGVVHRVVGSVRKKPQKRWHRVKELLTCVTLRFRVPLDGVGARGQASMYPWAAVWSPPSGRYALVPRDDLKAGV
jgi:hypothetical protein